MESLQNKETKSNALVIIFKVLLFIIDKYFSGLAVLMLNIDLTKASSFFEHSWFSKQKRRNALVAIVLFIFSLGSPVAGYYFIKKSGLYEQVIAAPLKQIKKGNFKKAFKYKSKSSYKERYLNLGLIFIAAPLFLGIIVNLTHPHIVLTRRLQRSLKRNGYSKENGDYLYAFYTNVGVMIDVGVHNPKEVSQNDKIWIPLNIRVDSQDWLENESKRSLIFLKSKFELKSKYIYNLEE